MGSLFPDSSYCHKSRCGIQIAGDRATLESPRSDRQAGCAVGGDECLERPGRNESRAGFSREETEKSIAQKWGYRRDDPRIEIVRALGSKGGREIIPLLARFAGDRNALMAIEACNGLGRIGSPEIVEPLLAATHAREKAMGGSNPMDRPAQAIVNALVRVGKPAVGPLLKALQDNEPALRAYCAEALGKIGDRRATGQLCAAINDPDGLVAFKAVQALKGLKDPRSVDALISALNKKGGVADIASYALKGIGAPAAAPLARALREDDLTLRLNLADVLISIGPPAARPVSRNLSGEDVSPLLVSSRVLEWIGRDSPDALSPLLRDRNENIRRRVAQLLGDLADRRSTEALIGILQQDNDALVRCRAAEALGKLRDRRALQALRVASGARHAQIREAALWALAQF